MLFANPRDDPDETIAPFLAVLAAGREVDPGRLANAGRYVAIAVGGEPSEYYPVDSSPRPGSFLAERAVAGYTVSEPEWVEMLRRRLVELVENGVEPAFLIRSLAHYVRDWYRDLATDTDITDERRARTRQLMYDTADDPELLAQYRRNRKTDDSMSDDEVAETLRRVADKLEPVSVEEIAGNWAILDAWERDVAPLLDVD